MNNLYLAVIIKHYSIFNIVVTILFEFANIMTMMFT